MFALCSCSRKALPLLMPGLLWADTGLGAPARAPPGDGLPSHAYRCENGMTFTAKFDNAARTLWAFFPDDRWFGMQQTVSGSGIRYRWGDTVFHGKGDTALWMVDDRLVTTCRTDG